MRILHVTEAMGGGVLTLMDTISRRQAELGADVSVWFLPRPETPNDLELEGIFDERVSISRLSEESSGARRYLALIKAVRSVSTGDQFDVIHLHSSKAGAAGRLATIFLRNRRSVLVYSPHGFAFLREDTSWFERQATLIAEIVMSSYCDGLVLTSKSEQKLAVEQMPAASTYLLNTGIPIEMLRPINLSKVERERRRLRVGMVGRVCYQKAPWRFAAAARALKDTADFVWIGGGAPEDIDRWLDDPALEITGWLAPDELAREIDGIDILLFPTLWEGMALSLMQAQAQGIPAVVSDAVGNVDSVIDGKTGFVCSTDTELILRLQQLLLDDELRIEMGQAAVRWAEESLLDSRVGADSMSIYRSISTSGDLVLHT